MAISGHLGGNTQDVTVLREAVEQGCGHLGVAKNAYPRAEVWVGCDDGAGALIG